MTRLSGNPSIPRFPYSPSWSIIMGSHSGNIRGRGSRSWKKLADESREGGIQNASDNAASVGEQENLALCRVRIDLRRFVEPAAHSSRAKTLECRAMMSRANSPWAVFRRTKLFSTRDHAATRWCKESQLNRERDLTHPRWPAKACLGSEDAVCATTGASWINLQAPSVQAVTCEGFRKR